MASDCFFEVSTPFPSKLWVCNTKHYHQIDNLKRGRSGALVKLKIYHVNIFPTYLKKKKGIQTSIALKLHKFQLFSQT